MLRSPYWCWQVDCRTWTELGLVEVAMTAAETEERQDGDEASERNAVLILPTQGLRRLCEH